MGLNNVNIFQYKCSENVFLSSVNTVTNKAILEKFLKYYIKLSITDALTGAYNKRYLMRYLPDNLCNYYVCMIDVNDFKTINDTLGHVDADNVLVDICNIIRSEMHEQDLIIRFGGDEFIVLCTASKMVQIQQALRNVQCKIYEKYKNQPIHPEISYGIAKHRKQCQIQDTIRKADFLMYASRRNSRFIKMRSKK